MVQEVQAMEDRVLAVVVVAGVVVEATVAAAATHQEEAVDPLAILPATADPVHVHK